MALQIHDITLPERSRRIKKLVIFMVCILWVTHFSHEKKTTIWYQKKLIFLKNSSIAKDLVRKHITVAAKELYFSKDQNCSIKSPNYDNEITHTLNFQNAILPQKFLNNYASMSTWRKEIYMSNEYISLLSCYGRLEVSGTSNHEKSFRTINDLQ